MITITQEMLDQLTVLYNDNEEKNNRYIDKYLNETDSYIRQKYEKFAFGCVCTSKALDKVFSILGLEADINTDNYEYTVKEVNNGNKN